MSESETNSANKRLPWWIGLLAFLVILLPFQWEEHKVHILGVLPYLLLLSCPLIHFFMHRGHGGGTAGHDHRNPSGRGGAA